MTSTVLTLKQTKFSADVWKFHMHANGHFNRKSIATSRSKEKKNDTVYTNVIGFYFQFYCVSIKWTFSCNLDTFQQQLFLAFRCFPLSFGVINC